ncbi:DUF4258 domain-containing protein [Spirosoma luteum]|uniref:DUF4258 domain-containing protein n=1 Tax=Spirosoma luteum TaxID=431553 RepID=UPI00036F1715|nr:DUF4258 domain-containing protein [Spirosoma luteum]
METDFTTCVINFSKHAQEQAVERGTTVEEMEKAIRHGVHEIAKKNRQKAKFTFTFGLEWHGRFYALKQVEPVFVVEENVVTVITVYTYYF